MRKIFITAFLSVSSALNLYAQTNDSIEVKQVTYNPNLNKGETVKLTAQQLRANSDYEKGYFLVGNHEYKKAIKPLLRAIEIDSTGNCGTGKNGMAFSELGYAYTRLNDFDNAKNYLEQAIKLNKYVPSPYLSKAVILMKQGNNELALKTLNSLVENIPDHAIGYVQRGFLYNSTGEYELALQDFNTFLRIVKDQEQSSNELIQDIQKQVSELEKKIK